jgi:hypothetical protein
VIPSFGRKCVRVGSTPHWILITTHRPSYASGGVRVRHGRALCLSAGHFTHGVMERQAQDFHAQVDGVTCEFALGPAP